MNWIYKTTIFAFSFLLFFVVAKNARAVVWDDFNTYNLGQDLVDTAWNRFSGNARCYVEGDVFNKYAECRATTTGQFAIYLRDWTPQVAQNVLCWDYKSQAGHNAYFRTRNSAVANFATRAYFQTDNSGLTKVFYNSGSGALIDSGFIYRTDNQYINICHQWDCVADKWNMYVNGFKIVSNANTYNNCGLVGRFEWETYPNPASNPGAKMFVDNVTYGEVTPANWQPISVAYDQSLIQWRSDINTVDYQLCYFGDDCPLWFSYNNLAIGNKVYLTPDQQLQQNPSYALSSTTITYDARYVNFIDTPDQTIATKTDYCLYMIDNEYGDLVSCGITIEWIASSTFGSDRFMKDPCASVATSTGTILDDIRYALECGARRVIYFAFTPDPDTVKDFTGSAQQIKEIFPFNIVFELTDTIKIGLEQSQFKNDFFKIPFIKATGEIYMMPVLSTSSVSNLIGEENESLYRTTMSYGMWVITAGMILFILI